MAASAVPPPETKATEVRRMFGAIAPRYDLLNHLLSANRDRAWRRRAVDRLLESSARGVPGVHGAAGGSGGAAASSARPVFLDACAGTFDLAVELADRDTFDGDVLAFDFSYPMLDAGRSKLAGRRVRPACADALQLPLPDASVDGAMVAFGVRNLASVEDGLREFARVIRPGGRLVILEFMTPQWQPFRALYLSYFRRVLPLVGRMISKHGSAYTYLPESVLRFPEPPALAGMIGAAGFTDVAWESLTGGIVAVHHAERI